MRSIHILVPVYNEENTVREVVSSLINRDYNVICVNDGSQDNSANILNELKELYPSKINIYTHLINMGLGAALRTGMLAAIKLNAKYLVTFDADGQHDIEDIPKVTKPLIDNEADVVIGVRSFEDMPATRRLGNQGMNLVTKIFYGANVSDSQSGLRAFKCKILKKIHLRTFDYGISSEIIKEVQKNNFKMKEVGIETIYTDETQNKGTDTFVAIKIILKIILNKIKGA